MPRSILESLVEDLEKRGDLDFTECFIDGTFVVNNEGTIGGKDQVRVRSSWWWQSL